MPNCDFYAHGEDFPQVLEFVFAQPGWVLHELGSELDRPVRVFRSADALLAASAFGSQSQHFQLHTPELGGVVTHQRVDFRPGAVPGHTHRFTTEGWGLIQLYFGQVTADSGLTNSHTNHSSELRASKWAHRAAGKGADHPTLWDWAAVRRTSGRLNRFLRKLAVAKHGSRPVLPAAHAAVERGAIRLLPEYRH